jgi:hypothetical protein
MVDTAISQPNGSFRWVQAGASRGLVCAALEPFARHLYTTRDWQLGTHTVRDDSPGWADVARALDVDPRRLVRVRQVHGAKVVVHRAGESLPMTRPDADIIISDDPAAVVAIQTADCVPILVADRRRGVVAAAHAGWRGLAAGVPRVTVEALVREFGSRPADLIAAAGPAIGPCCYEVGDDVREAFETAGFSASSIDQWFGLEPKPSALNASLPTLPPRPRLGYWFFDPWAATEDQLEEAGVLTADIHIAEACTASHPKLFCSYRCDGAVAGRLAAAIRVMP